MPKRQQKSTEVQATAAVTRAESFAPPSPPKPVDPRPSPEMTPHRSAGKVRLRWEVITHLRELLGYSLDALSDKSDVSKKTFDRIRNGRRVHLSTVSKIAAALKTTCDDLIQSDDAKPESPFELRVVIEGVVHTRREVDLMSNVGSEIDVWLRRRGARIRTCETKFRVDEPKGTTASSKPLKYSQNIEARHEERK